MRKKAYAILAILTLLTACGHCEVDLSATPAPTVAPLALSPISVAPLEDRIPVNVSCAAALLLEQDSGQIIFQMNESMQRPVASVTKVMTILLTLEMLESGRIGLEDEIVISKTAAGMGGSQVLLDVGERQTVRTLLKCMIVGSANDAAVALSEAMYGSEDACVEAMNRRAEALSMNDTHFVNCTGLPAEGQHTTARDAAIMAREVFAHPLYYEFSKTWMEDINHGDGRVTQLVNTNKLLRLYDGCDGGKTGSTKEAGYCVCATASRGGMRLIAVVLGAESGTARFEIASRMLDYGFANYRRYPVAQRGTRVRGVLPVTGGEADGVALTLDSDLTLLIKKGDEQRIQLTPHLPQSLAAPIHAGDTVGSVAVKLDERVVAELPIVAADSVQARGLGPGFERFWNHWVAITL